MKRVHIDLTIAHAAFEDRGEGQETAGTMDADPRSPKTPPKDETAAALRASLGCEFCYGSGESEDNGRRISCPHCTLPNLRALIRDML